MGLFDKFKSALTKTSSSISSVFSNFRKVDEEFFEELEECLILSDVGGETTEAILNDLRDRAKKENIKDSEEIKTALKDIMKAHLDVTIPEYEYPLVILMVGVNGVGKTTIIGKLSNMFKKQGKSVLIAAADTFRAAAVEQLLEWGKRSGTQVIHNKEGSDPAAVVYDAVNSARARGYDILIVDTAGRLHNKKNLMDELNKIRRTIDKNYENAKVVTFLALDATTGQNGVNQAEVFTETANVDAVCINKLDGTAKGGVVLAICDKIGIPVKYIGVGEGIDDILEFNKDSFVDAIVDQVSGEEKPEEK